jgi:hypothetical protein
MKPWLVYLLVALSGLALGIVVAKYTLPPRVEERERVVEREVVKWKDKEIVTQGPVRVTTKTVTVPGPAGPTVTVEKIVEKEKVVTVHVQDGSADTSSEREKEKITDSRPWFALEAAGAIAPATGRWAWTGGAQFRVIGPLWAGAGVVVTDTLYVGPSLRMEF